MFSVKDNMVQEYRKNILNDLYLRRVQEKAVETNVDNASFCIRTYNLSFWYCVYCPWCILILITEFSFIHYRVQKKKGHF